MRKTAVLSALALTTAALSSPAFAAPKLAKAKVLLVKDTAGDANFLTSQLGVGAVDNVATPTSLKDSDILSFSLARLDNGTKVKAVVATLNLAAAPTSGRDYRIKMASPSCSTYFLEFEWLPGGALAPAGEIRDNCAPLPAGSTANFTPVDAVIKGSSIVWTIPISAFTGDVKLGTVLTVKGAESSVETVAIAPQIDRVTVNTTYKIGQ